MTPPPAEDVRPSEKGRSLTDRMYWGVVILLAVALLFASIAFGSNSVPVRPVTVVASLPHWNIGNGTSVVLANRESFTEVSPWMFGLDRDGRIVPLYDKEFADTADRSVTRLRAAKLSITPSLANMIDGRFAYQPLARILHDPDARARHVASIVALVSDGDYDGIDVDYEELRGRDRQAFTTFITELADALHARQKTLSVALFAKTSDEGYDQRNLAQDYAAIGRVADQVRLMAYDYHWATSSPGPVAPVYWVRDVLSYAKTRIPADKIVLGVPLYGYDWADGVGTPVTWLQTFRLATEHRARVHYDSEGQTPWFEYTDSSGRRHQVWFENAPSTRAKLDAAAGARIGGVFLWMYGYEDTDVWKVLRTNFPVSSTSTSPGGPR